MNVNKERLVALRFLIEKLEKYSDSSTPEGQDEKVYGSNRSLLRDCIKILCQGIAEEELNGVI